MNQCFETENSEFEFIKEYIKRRIINSDNRISKYDLYKVSCNENNFEFIKEYIKRQAYKEGYIVNETELIIEFEKLYF